MDNFINIKKPENEFFKFDGGTPSIYIGIIDGEIDFKHDAIRNSKISRLKEENHYQKSGQGISHGTAIASVLFGEPGSVTPGLAWQCSGVSRPIYKDGPQGLIPASQEDLAVAIRELMAAGVHIINISGGEMTAPGRKSAALEHALQAAEDANVLIVAAAGNDGCDCAHMPAAYPTVLAVGAIDAEGIPLPSSNWGAHYTAHGIVAQGQGIQTAKPGNSTTNATGTSISAAIVSGTAALLMSAGLRAGATFSAADIRNALIAGSRPEYGPQAHRYLSGHLNISGALARLFPALINPQIKSEDIMTDTDTLDIQQDNAIAPSSIATAAVAAAPAAAQATSAVLPSQEVECTTCAKSSGSKLVYALGTLGYDFGSESRRLSLGQNLNRQALNDPASLLDALSTTPSLAESIIWTLSVDEVPLYAVRPQGAFAADGYKLLLELFADQLNEGAERISVPGIITENTILYNGTVVPVITPEQRGMFSWTTQALTKSILGDAEGEIAEQKKAGIANFLERVYYEVRNFGQTPEDRAINFAATQAYQIEQVFERAIEDQMQLDSINVERSPLLRPGANSWDVKLVFFSPSKRLEQARLIFRFTVDVSDVIPVMVGKVRHWYAY